MYYKTKATNTLYCNITVKHTPTSSKPFCLVLSCSFMPKTKPSKAQFYSQHNLFTSSSYLMSAIKKLVQTTNAQNYQITCSQQASVYPAVYTCYFGAYEDPANVMYN
jgi:hypothetical protein